MSVQTVKCSACGAPATATRFQRSATCAFCGVTFFIDPDAVPRARFAAALVEWNEQGQVGHDAQRCVGLAGRTWALRTRLARGDSCDVYEGTLARTPTERVVVKILRRGANDDARTRLHHEHDVLARLAASTAPGADTFATRVPNVVARGVVGAGGSDYAGREALVLRWQSGFVHTFAEVREAYPTGVAAHHSAWIWRRVLEVLSFAHRSGVAHGAITPAHLLVHPREHGVLPVGWGRAVEATPSAVAADLRESARAVGFVLDGSDTPVSVAQLLVDVARRPEDHTDAWALRERVGEVARAAFGPPTFIPFEMPGWR
jgi:hypothetical protein